MELIVISDPGIVADEAVIINRLFESGMTRFHLRKPDWNVNQLNALLIQLDKSFQSKIALHQHHYLNEHFNLKGLHYKEYDRFYTSQEKLTQQKKQGYVLSTSVHNLEIWKSSGTFDYVFFGPVFNSISKPNYLSQLKEGFHLEKTSAVPKIIALGGIDQSNINQVKEMNFDGAAVLGAIWKNPYLAITNFNKLKELANKK